jgi:hypothetical protein
VAALFPMDVGNPSIGYRRADMEVILEGMIDRHTETQWERIYTELLKEAIKGLADLKGGQDHKPRPTQIAP